jgi:type II secretory ATPase GspE/PulE/Tfp pilus assembly ATPase PilB-like protein
VTEEIRRLIIQRASSAVIKEAAVHGGMRTLRRAGLDKAAQGVTSLEEVLRITSEDH